MEDEVVKKYDAYFAKNYEQIHSSMEAFANSKLDRFDEDIFHDTYLKVREKLEKDGIEDTSDLGLLNYFFKAFKQNTLREKDYARNRRNDDNVGQEQLTALYEEWSEKQAISTKEKLLKDLKVDFMALRMAEMVEENFDAEHFYLWRIKTFMDLTYKDLAKRTRIPSARNKVLEVQEFLRNNVKKEDLEKEFQNRFSDLIDF